MRSAGLLAQCELYIKGVIEDHILAHMWLNVASANDTGFVAGHARDLIEANMTRTEILRATELARAWMASDYQDCEP